MNVPPVHHRISFILYVGPMWGNPAIIKFWEMGGT